MYSARQAPDTPTNLSDISSVISSLISSATDGNTSTDGPTSDPASLLPISTNSTTLPPSTEPTPLPPTPAPTSPASQLPNATSSVDASNSAVQLASPTFTDFSLVISSSNTSTFPSATANLTTIVTSVGGIPTTVITQLPTSLVSSSPTVSDSHRTAIIAGTTSAVFALIVLVLAATFAHRKHALRKAEASSGRRREGHGLLDGEDFDDDIPPHMRQIPSHRHSLARSTSPVPSLLKSRVADTGSIFREEVWPPPGLVDPISKRNNQVDLSKIVDDVMGPSTSRQHERDLTDATTVSNVSATTTTPLIGDDHRQQSLSSSGYDDPFGVSGSQVSFYSASSSYLPPGASPPAQPGLMSSPSQISAVDSSSPLSVSTSTASIPVSTLPVLVLHPRPVSSSTLPKKSSPLARALTQDPKLLSGDR